MSGGTFLSRMMAARNRSTLLFACAGFAVMSGIMCGMPAWGNSLAAALGFVALAVVLGTAAFVKFDGAENDEGAGRSKSYRGWLIIGGLAVFHLFVAVHYCKSVTAEDIDCYTFQRDAAHDLLHGVDPYGGTRANIYSPAEASRFYGPGVVVDGRVQVGLQYPPVTVLWVLPGYLLGDIRYSYILAVVLSALLLYAAAPGIWSLCAASFLLINPFTYVVEDRGWTEPMVLMAMSATVYAAVKGRRWLPVALGVFLATKQYNFLALPFLGALLRPFAWRAYWRLTGMSCAIALTTALPFAWWNFRGLWHDLVVFHLAQPFRADALSFAVPFPPFQAIGPVLVLLFMVWAVRSGLKSPAMLAGGYGISLLLFVSTSKQAFGNYYFLVAHLLLLASAAQCAVAPSRTVRLERESL